jgi:hypothetical protein
LSTSSEQNGHLSLAPVPFRKSILAPLMDPG